MGLYQL